VACFVEQIHCDEYGQYDLSQWDVGYLTDMKCMFKDAVSFNVGRMSAKLSR
jgi:hypothetical protein